MTALSWTSVPGAASYQLQEGADASFGGAVTLDRGSTTDYDATGKPPGLYYYRVKARNGAGGESPWSNTRWVKVE